MKPFLVLSFVFTCTAAFSQFNQNSVPRLSPEYPLYHYDFKQKTITIPFDHNPYGFQNPFSLKSGNGGVVYLPQDHMPCIVPFPATQALIPNLWRMPEFPMAGKIPNPAQPLDFRQPPPSNNLPIIELPYYSK